MNQNLNSRTTDNDGAITVPIVKVRDSGIFNNRIDRVAIEEPLQITLVTEGKDMIDYAVIMRTPVMDEFLATGFLYSEGVLRSPEDIMSIGNLQDNKSINNRVIFYLKIIDDPPRKRNFNVNSSCGVCGKESIDEIFTRIGKVNRSNLRISPETISNMPKTMLGKQVIFSSTGGIHAAGVFDAQGNLIFVAEDIGRHNAVDKVIGFLLLNGKLPASGLVLQVSGRAGFEIVQKAALANIPIVCSVSAPSSLAVETADALGITLVCFVRNNNFNVYTHPERITTGQ